MIRRRLCATALLALPLGAAAAVTATQPASALSCVSPETWTATSSWVVTGAILDVDQASLVVAVDEVWRGPMLPEVVRLRISDELGYGRELAAADADATTTWVFGPQVEASGSAAVNLCSATPLTADQVDRLRPADARPPVGLTEAERTRPATPWTWSPAPRVVDGGGVVAWLATLCWWLRS